MTKTYHMAMDQRETALREARNFADANPISTYNLGGHQLRCLAALALESAMTLDEAFKVAKAIGECTDIPVIHGIFSDLNQAFPDFKFVLIDSGDAMGDFTVIHASGKRMSGNIFE